MRKILCIVTVCFMIVSSLSGCSVLQKFGFGGNNDELHPVSSVVMGEEEAQQLSDKVPIHLYFATEDNTKLKLEIRYLSVAEAKKSTNNLATKIVEELIKGPNQAGLKPTIPASAKLVAPVTVDVASATATVNFTKDFVDKHQGGKEASTLTLYSITNSLTELKEVQKVKFLINGKTQADFKGSFQFNVPFPRNASLISMIVPAAGTAIPANAKNSTNPGTTDKSKTVSPTPKASTKVTPTPTPKPGDSKSTSGATAEEDAEATYLEILE